MELFKQDLLNHKLDLAYIKFIKNYVNNKKTAFI